LKNPIAVIDSGVGGLTVVQELARQIPKEVIVYFGDTARCPYGPLKQEEIRQYSFEMIEYLRQFQPKMLIIACNTATAVILEEIRSVSTIPIIGVIHPGVRAAIKATITGRIGVIGTKATVQSGLYEKALREVHPELYITSLACPTLVSLSEEGGFHQRSAIRIVEQALEPMKRENIDTLILGCTHFPLLSDLIQRVMGDDVNLISSADETAREVSTILFHKNLFSKTFSHPQHRFFTSGDPKLFKEIGEEWLNFQIDVKRVDL
jgi:glutamate racemase